MLISVKGEPTPELWAAADITGLELHARNYGSDAICVYASGYSVCDDLTWSSYVDLVSQLRDLKRREGVRTGAWYA